MMLQATMDEVYLKSLLEKLQPLLPAEYIMQELYSAPQLMQCSSLLVNTKVSLNTPTLSSRLLSIPYL